MRSRVVWVVLLCVVLVVGVSLGAEALRFKDIKALSPSEFAALVRISSAEGQKPVVGGTPEEVLVNALTGITKLLWTNIGLLSDPAIRRMMGQREIDCAKLLMVYTAAIAVLENAEIEHRFLRGNPAKIQVTLTAPQVATTTMFAVVFLGAGSGVPEPDLEQIVLQDVEKFTDMVLRLFSSKSPLLRTEERLSLTILVEGSDGLLQTKQPLMAICQDFVSVIMDAMERGLRKYRR